MEKPATMDEGRAPAGGSAGSGWSGGVAALIVLVVGLGMTHAPVFHSGFARMHGELGDTRLIISILDHSWRWLSGEELHRAFWDPPVFFPAKNTLAYSEILLGTAPLFWVWRAAGALPDTAFQLWLLSSSVLNFLCAWALLRRGLRLAPWASAGGAFLFAFGAPRVAQSGHFQLFPHFPSMVFVWAVVESLRAEAPRARRAWLITAAGAAVVQLYASFYLGWFLALGTVLVLGIVLALAEERRRFLAWGRASAWTLAAAGVVAALWVAPMALAHLRAASEVGLRRFRDVMPMLPRPASWVAMSEHSWLYGGLAKWAAFDSLPFRHEHLLGIGPFTTALAVFGLWRARRSPGVRLWAWGLVAILAVTLLLPKGITLWGAFYAVFPGAKAVRAMSRIGLLALIPLGVGVALALDGLERAKGRRRAFGVLPLILLSMAEQGQEVPSYDKAADRARVRWLAGLVPPDCEAFFFTPVHSPHAAWYVHELDAVLAADLAGIATVNGYSGNWPPGYLARGGNGVQQQEDHTRVAGMLDRWTRLHEFALPEHCWVRATAYGERLDAALVSVRMEAAATAGEPFTAALTWRNTGTVPWVRSRHYRLGAAGDSTAWGPHRFELPADVPPGAEVTVALTLRAPVPAGRHPFRWQLVHEGIRWFGPVTEAWIDVAPPAASGAP